MSCNQESFNKLENVDYLISDDLLYFNFSFARGKAIKGDIVKFMLRNYFLFHKELFKKGEVTVTVLFNSGKINSTLGIKNEQQPENRNFITRTVIWSRSTKTI